MFYLVLLYIITFYTQPGSRFPALGAIRFELLLGGLIVLTLFFRKGKKLFKSTQLNKAILFMFFSFCASFFGAFVTHTISSAVPILIQVIKYFCVYIMIIGTIDNVKKMKFFMLVYIGVIFFYFTEALIVGNFFFNPSGPHLQAIGQFGHYNSLGGITASNMSFISQLIFVAPFVIKLIFVIFGAIGFRVIVLTGSRTAYVGVMVLGLIWIFLSKRKFIMSIVVIAFMFVVFIYMPQEYKERFYTLGQAKDVIAGEEVNDSMTGRWIIIKDAWKVFLQYPIVGCGLNSFYPVRGRLFNRWQQTHNLYMQILTNIGAVGGIAFGYFLLTIFKYLKYCKTKLLAMGMQKHYLMYMVKALYMFIIMRLTVGMFGHDLYENYWWFIAGLTMVVTDLVQKRAAVFEETRSDTDKN